MIIFTKTCERDLPLLYYMVRSVAKHCMWRGPKRHVVMIENKHVDACRKVCEGVPTVEVIPTSWLPMHDVIAQLGTPYLAQQYAKMMLDALFPKQQTFFQLDSDMILERELSNPTAVCTGNWSKVHRDQMPQSIREQWDTRWWEVDALVTGRRTEYSYMYAGSGWCVSSQRLWALRNWLSDLTGMPLWTMLIDLWSKYRTEDFSEYHTYGKYLDMGGECGDAFWNTTTEPCYPQVWTFSGRVDWTKNHRIRLAKAIGEEPRP